MNHMGRFCAVALTAVAALVSGGGVALGQDAEMQQRINAAVDKAVEYLKGQQQKDGFFPDGHNPGASTLAAWALLECGVPADDKSIQAVAAIVRKAALDEVRIYHAALMIFFLNRLGDPVDVPLIQVLGLRLLQGQRNNGGWGYEIGGPPTEAEVKQVTTLVEARKKAIQAKDPKVATFSKVLPPALAPIGLRLSFRTPAQMSPFGSDNSNTQFAMLALWVARRYGVPADHSLFLVGNYFRRLQWPDGSWPYEGVTLPGGPPPAPAYHGHAMTCSGLLGLALAHANDKNRAANKLLTQDPQVRLGFTRLSKILDGTFEYRTDGGPNREREEGRRYYFMWSLERVAVVYDLKKIGGVDWHLWGSKRMVESQAGDGSWNGECGRIPDTSFCLLFLKKVNIAEDLTKNLKKSVPKTGTGRLPDPLLELLPVEDTSKTPGSKKTSEKPKQSSRLQLPAVFPAGWPTAPAIATLTASGPQPLFRRLRPVHC